jgi:hypothetical protein
VRLLAAYYPKARTSATSITLIKPGTEVGPTPLQSRATCWPAPTPKLCV